MINSVIRREGFGARLAKAAMASGLIGGLLVGGSLTASATVPAGPGHRSATDLTESHVVLGPGMSGNLTNRLDSVSCVSSTSCVAVGGGGNPPDSTQTLAEIWNGTSWAVVPSPDPSGYLNGLLGVSCTGSTFCMAVGSTAFEASQEGIPMNQTLAETWDGNAWSVVPSPGVPDSVNAFAGVSCTSPMSCVAVGTDWPLDATYKFKTLIESWNGSIWSVVANEGPPLGGYLSGVSCVSSTDCVAVGLNNSGDTLVMSWSGSTWSVVSSPGIENDTTVLTGVTCISTNNCTAVGSASNLSNGSQYTLIEAWDGSVWTVVPSPSRAGTGDALNDVSCATPIYCVATGYQFEPGENGQQLNLIESWDGSSWSVVPSPSPSSSRNNLQGVHCSGPLLCLAVGWTVNGLGNPQTLVESWDGSDWTIVPSPNADTLVAPVVSMASAPTGDGYWLVDSAGDVTAHGAALNYGSMSGRTVNAPIAHIVSTPDGKGYWLVAGDGGIFSFGDAHFYGSMGGKRLNAPVVDMAPTPSGRGYWLVAGDGGVFSFGDAVFSGSMGGRSLNRPVVGVAADIHTGGYWLVASDGGIFSFGAPFLGSMGAIALNEPVNGMASTPHGDGYWLTANDGGIFAFGDASFRGSMGGQALNAPVVGMASDSSTSGYWLVASDGGIFSFGAPFYGAG